MAFVKSGCDMFMFLGKSENSGREVLVPRWILEIVRIVYFFLISKPLLNSKRDVTTE